MSEKSKITRVNVHGRDKVTVTEFDSIEAVMAAIQADRASADADTKPWQKTVAPRDLVLIQVGPDQFDWAEVLASKNADFMPPSTVRTARVYRRGMPEGVVETFHCCSLKGWVKRDVFEAARKAKWPGERSTMAKEILRKAGPVDLGIYRHRV